MKFFAPLAVLVLAAPAAAENLLVPNFPPFNNHSASEPHDRYCDTVNRAIMTEEDRLTRTGPGGQLPASGPGSAAAIQERLDALYATKAANGC